MSRFSKVATGFAVVALLAWLVLQLLKPGYQRDLESGYDVFLAGLERAETNLTSLLALAPPRNERDLSDGYRYLMGHVLRVVQSELSRDPLNPKFERAVTELSKWTGDNPDNLYLIAAIDGTESYRISGRVPWANAAAVTRLADVPQAPGLVLFQTVTDLIGDTGSLQELTNCRNQTFADLNSFDMKVADDGSFEILLAPERPQAYTGNWLDTDAELSCTHRDGSITSERKTAGYITIREIFIDWSEEWPLELDIVRIDNEGHQTPTLSAQQRADQMRVMGNKIANQIEFWNGVMRLGLEAHGDFNFDGELKLPENSVNRPAPPFLAGGTAGSQQLYASGMYDLGPDEALILSVDLPVMPEYFGFQLSNVWMESLEQADYASSRNQSQLEFNRKASTYIVIAHRDPGVANWVDTTGIERGQMTFRFWYASTPEPALQPVIMSRKIPIDDVLKSWDFTRYPTPAERRAEIAERQKHLRRRFRHY